VLCKGKLIIHFWCCNFTYKMLKIDKFYFTWTFRTRHKYSINHKMDAHGPRVDSTSPLRERKRSLSSMGTPITPHGKGGLEWVTC
jgi:hypothetical protein